MVTNYARALPLSSRSSVNVGGAERKISLAVGVGLALAGLMSSGRARRALTMIQPMLSVTAAATRMTQSPTIRTVAVRLRFTV